MAQKWTNQNLAGALHFVTGNVLNRLSIFEQEKDCQIFLEQLQALRVKRECKLIAFVVMPDHFHLVVNPRDGNIRKLTGALKSLSANELIGNAPKDRFLQADSLNRVWQESFKALPLWSNWMIWQKINYIYANPVKAGLSDTARDYRWTSFRAFYLEEGDPLLQIDKDWWWPEDVRKLQEEMHKLQK